MAHYPASAPNRACHLYTLGHSTRSLEEFLACLATHGITDVVDVREHPCSSHHPHFTREALTPTLVDAGLDYHWLGKELGGFRKEGYRAHMTTELFLKGIYTVLALARMTANNELIAAGGPHLPDPAKNEACTPGKIGVCIMCAEFKWFRCHRRYIADWLVARGYRVTHILDVEQRVEHAAGLMGEARIWCDRRNSM